MRKILLAACVAIALPFALVGCAGDQSKGPTYPVVGTVDQTVMEQTAFAARSAYRETLRWAVEYSDLPRCSATRPMPCSSQSVVNELRKLDNTAFTATKGAVDLARSPTKTSLALTNAVTDALKTVSVFRDAVAAYNAKAAVN